MLEQTKQGLSQLKCYGALESLDIRLAEATSGNWGHIEFLSALVSDESLDRENRRVKRRLKAARFRTGATMESLDLTAKRSLSKTQVENLKSLRFINEPRNILIIGPTGVGKTFLATAIGNHACRNGYSCIFIGINMLIERLLMARADGTFLKYRDRLVKTDLLILDDLGIKPLPSETVQDLYDILEERYQAKSTLVTTQLPIANWKEVIHDEVALEAIVDRLIHGPIKLELKGESYRKKRDKKLSKSTA